MMQLELFDNQLQLFPDFVPEAQSVLEQPKAEKVPETIYVPFLADIEYLSRKRGYCSSGNRNFQESNLSSMFGKHERTIQRHLKAFVAADLIRIERNGPKRNIFMTARGMLTLQEAGFTPSPTPTSTAPSTPTVSPDPDTMPVLPRHNVGLPRQNVAHITSSKSIPVHQEAEAKRDEAEMVSGDTRIELFLPPEVETERKPRNIRESLELAAKRLEQCAA